MKYVVAAGLVLALQACGGSSSNSAGNSGPTGAAVEADVVAVCDAICERSTRCDLERGPPLRDRVSERERGPTFMRRDVLRGLWIVTAS